MGSRGVLFTAFGGPDSPEEVGPFMANLMGREPSPELVERAVTKYLAIGGKSPLQEITAEIVQATAERLGPDVVVGCGMRYWHPYISEMLQAMADSGVTRVVAVSLSPFESKVATGAYRDAIADALRTLPPMEVVEAPHMGGTDDFVGFFTLALGEAMNELTELKGENPLVVFTAHSLPMSEVDQDDPYVLGLEHVAASVAEESGIGSPQHLDGTGQLAGIETLGNLQSATPWVLCYQSKGNRAGEWLGPSLDEVIDAAAAAGFGSIVAVPIGFMTDHMETRYDLDIEAAGKVMDLGMEWVRSEVPNATTNMMDAMVGVIRSLLQ